LVGLDLEGVEFCIGLPVAALRAAVGEDVVLQPEQRSAISETAASSGNHEDGLGAQLISEYERRDRTVSGSLYALHNPGYLLMSQARERVSVRLLSEAALFPRAGTPCLEIGYGRLGALGTLIGWGLRESDLHGIEMDPRRAAVAQAAMSGADLRVGDARAMPWPDETFALVVAWTVFSSILNDAAREAVATEIVRVLKPGGALLYYDFAWNNPKNPNVRAVGRREIRSLFAGLTGSVRSATLAPPLARLVAPRSWLLATALDSMPFLRSHRVAVLVKGARATSPTSGP
jgi:SAM-dependent methyltransferase